jgi:S1-C subfamily serine protease
MKKISRLSLVSFLLILCFFVFSGCVNIIYNPNDKDPKPQNYAYSDLGQMINDVVKGCAEIKADASQGSGFLIGKDESNYPIFITNYHVIKQAHNIHIKLGDKADFYPQSAKVLGYDADMDIAVLTLNKEIDDIDGRILAWGNSRAVYKGQLVFAIGNPLGEGTSLTQGIISRSEELLEMLDDSGTKNDISDDRIICKHVIRHDAAINSGNSGGVLVNQNGEFIGINSYSYLAKIIDKEGYTTDDYKYLAHGMGLAIPSNFAKGIYDFVMTNYQGEPIDASSAREGLEECLINIKPALDDEDNNILEVKADIDALGLEKGDKIIKINQIGINEMFFDATQVCSPSIIMELCYYYSDTVVNENELKIMVLRDGHEQEISTGYYQSMELPVWLQELPFD